MKLWRRKKDIETHEEAVTALEQEMQARTEVEAKAEELAAKRPMVELLGRSLNRHLQENHFSNMIALALQARHEHH